MLGSDPRYPPQAQPPAGSYRLLVIVPDDDLREVILTGLELTTDWWAIAAQSDEEGLKFAIALDPHAIILNQPPNGQEPSLAMTLATGAETQHIPLILMANRVRGADIQHYSRRGFAGLISKPFDCAQLSQTIAQLLNWSH